jgi:hypothetical protein
LNLWAGKRGKGIDKNLKICYNLNVKKGDKRPAVARRRKNKSLPLSPQLISVGWGGESSLKVNKKNHLLQRGNQKFKVL